MSSKPAPHNHAWFNHETDPSKLAELSTAFSALQRERHAAGWRRNALLLFCAAGLVAALKLILAA